MDNETYQALHLFATKRIGSVDAADLVQDAYLRFLQVEDRQNIREPRAFLFRIIANLGIDFWRKERTRNQWMTDDADIDIEAIEGSRLTLDACLHQSKQVETLLAVLAELPESHRNAFVLNKFDGLSHARIAKQFGVHEKVIQRQIAEVVAHCANRLGYEE